MTQNAMGSCKDTCDMWQGHSNCDALPVVRSGRGWGRSCSQAREIRDEGRGGRWTAMEM